MLLEKLYLGTTQINKAYLGAVQIFPTAEEEFNILTEPALLVSSTDELLVPSRRPLMATVTRPLRYVQST